MEISSSPSNSVHYWCPEIVSMVCKYHTFVTFSVAHGVTVKVVRPFHQSQICIHMMVNAQQITFLFRKEREIYKTRERLKGKTSTTDNNKKEKKRDDRS